MTAFGDSLACLSSDNPQTVIPVTVSTSKPTPTHETYLSQPFGQIDNKVLGDLSRRPADLYNRRQHSGNPTQSCSPTNHQLDCPDMMEDSTMSDPSCDSCWSILPGQQIDDDVGLGVTKFFDQDRAQTPSRPAHVFHFPALVNGDDSAINRQPDSSLFHRLPFEIRMMIYREVLPAERRLWIRPATTHDSSCDFELFPAADAGPIDLEFREEMSQDNWRLTGRSFWKKAALGQAPLHTDSLALMKTCRRA